MLIRLFYALPWPFAYTVCASPSGGLNPARFAYSMIGRKPRLRELKLNKLRKSIKAYTGYGVHVTDKPQEVYNTPTIALPELGKFQNLWDGFIQLTHCKTLEEATEKGFFDPTETYHTRQLEGYPEFFSELLKMPISNLEKLKNFYPDRNAPLYVYDVTREGMLWGLVKALGIYIVTLSEDSAIAYSFGLPVYIGQTLGNGINKALQAHPSTSYLLAFPIKTGSEVFCKPLGLWIAMPNYLSSQAAYAIQVDC